VVTLDRQLRIVSLTRGAESLLGWRSEEVEGKPASDVFDDREPASEALAIARRILEGSARETGVVRFRAKDGAPVSCAVTATAVPGTMGGPAEVLYALSRTDDAATKGRRGRTGGD
jgi:PAS domain S-box-containing protein